MILISVLYQNVSTSRILEPSPQGLISRVLKWKRQSLLFDKQKCWPLRTCFSVSYIKSSLTSPTLTEVNGRGQVSTNSSSLSHRKLLGLLSLRWSTFVQKDDCRLLNNCYVKLKKVKRCFHSKYIILLSFEWKYLVVLLWICSACNNSNFLLI